MDIKDINKKLQESLDNIKTTIQNDNDNRIAKYKYRINLDKEE